MTIELSSTVHDGLLGEAAAAHPRECCGILLGETAIDAFAPAANVHPMPDRHFEIDPRALIDAYRRERTGAARIAGYYHSHPNGRPGPSPTDALHASGDGKVWAIVAQGKVTLWRDEGIFKPLPYRLVKP